MTTNTIHIILIQWENSKHLSRTTNTNFHLTNNSRHSIQMPRLANAKAMLFEKMRLFQSKIMDIRRMTFWAEKQMYPKTFTIWKIVFHIRITFHSQR